RFDLLSAGPRDAPPRQQTLRAAIAWSYDLLVPPDQRLFVELGVFVDGFTLELAEAVCGPAALDGISTLVDQSLVTRAGSRFEMLENVRQFALDRLARSGRLHDLRRRHAQAFTDAVAGGERGLHGPEAALWLERLDADREDVRAAIAFSLAEGDAETALRLCAGVWRYWVSRGNLGEGRRFAAAALAGA